MPYYTLCMYPCTCCATLLNFGLQGTYAYTRTAVSGSVAEVAKPPKNWRWFDVFREPAAEALLRLQAFPAQLLRRARALIDVVQARRHKRKRFVQTVRHAAV